jgi:hypothetical protein
MVEIGHEPGETAESVGRLDRSLVVAVGYWHTRRRIVPATPKRAQGLFQLAQGDGGDWLRQFAAQSAANK